jgi:hypothetical protein
LPDRTNRYGKRIARVKSVVVKRKLLKLERECQETLARFLNTDINLAAAFAEIAKVTNSSKHRVQLVDRVNAALEMVRHCEGRIVRDSRGAWLGSAMRA